MNIGNSLNTSLHTAYYSIVLCKMMTTTIQQDNTNKVVNGQEKEDMLVELKGNVTGTENTVCFHTRIYNDNIAKFATGYGTIRSIRFEIPITVSCTTQISLYDHIDNFTISIGYKHLLNVSGNYLLLNYVRQAQRKALDILFGELVPHFTLDIDFADYGINELNLFELFNHPIDILLTFKETYTQRLTEYTIKRFIFYGHMRAFAKHPYKSPEIYNAASHTGKTYNIITPTCYNFIMVNGCIELHTLRLNCQKNQLLNNGIWIYLSDIDRTYNSTHITFLLNDKPLRSKNIGNGLFFLKLDINGHIFGNHLNKLYIKHLDSVIPSSSNKVEIFTEQHNKFRVSHGLGVLQTLG